MCGAETVISLQGVSLSLGEFALDEVDLEVRTGEYLVLLGPTGGGKTVLLETILGLHPAPRGTLILGGEVADGWAPEARGLGYVPQDYALFPNLDVEENLAFALRVRGWEEAATRKRIGELLEILGISHLRGRGVANLSGGEKQRVAVGRALAARPKVLILDEPLSALHESRRDELADELRRIQRASGAAFVHVCHSLEEAARVADRVVLLDQGRVVQVGPLEELLYRPVSCFVARFTGCQNLFSVEQIRDEGPAGESWLEAVNPEVTHLAIRPEAMLWTATIPAAEEGTSLEVEVVETRPRAGGSEVRMRRWGVGAGVAVLEWVAHLPRSQLPPTPGTRGWLTVPPEAIWGIREGYNGSVPPSRGG